MKTKFLILFLLLAFSPLVSALDIYTLVGINSSSTKYVRQGFSGDCGDYYAVYATLSGGSPNAGQEVGQNGVNQIAPLGTTTVHAGSIGGWNSSSSPLSVYLEGRLYHNTSYVVVDSLTITTNQATWGHVFTMQFNPDDCSTVVPACYTNLSWTFTDHSQYGGVYAIVDMHNTYSDGTHQYYASARLRPGDSHVFNLDDVPCTNASWYVFAKVSDLSFLIQDDTNFFYFSGDVTVLSTNSSPYVYTADQSPSGTQYNPAGSNSNILWTAAASTNNSLAIQQGDSAIYDALTKASAQAHVDANSVLWSISNNPSLNVLGGISNLLVGAATNGSGSGLNLTNVSTEGTLSGISNLLSSWRTNSATNDLIADRAASSSYEIEGSNLWLIAGSELPGSGIVMGDDIGDTWKIHVPYLSGYDIDLNPMHNSDIASVANFLHSVITWISVVGLFWNNISCLLAAQRSAGSMRQTTFAFAQVAGTNFSLVIAIATAVAITLVMLAIPAAGFVLAGGMDGVSFSVLHSNPFDGNSHLLSAAARKGLWLADQFFPIAFMVYCVLGAIFYRMQIGAVLWAVQTATRFFVG